MVESCNFTFADKNSSEYGIVLCDMEGLADTLFSGADSEIIADSISGNSRQLVYGVRENGQAEFQLKLLLPDDVEFETVCDIKDWLFRHDRPQKLIINHPDLQDYYFWCFLRYGDDYQDYKGYRVMSFTVQSISPYAYKNPISFTFNTRSETPAYYTINNINSSEINGIKPIITVKQQSQYNRDVIIANPATHTKCYVVGKNFNTNQELVINTQNKIIRKLTPNKDGYITEYAPNQLKLSEDFGFIYLQNGKNIFSIQGWADVTIEYTPCRRIGGV